jgi:hypothetical protein
LPRRPLDRERRLLETATPPSIRAVDWAGADDRSRPLSRGVLMAALSAGARDASTMVSVSHDDYVANVGGIQNLIADEQRAFEAAGWRYLHLSPAAPLPMLADRCPEDAYRLRLRLNGKPLGVATFQDLAAALAESRIHGARTTFVFHQLLGHVPELLATLPAAADGGSIAWLHDYFTLCPSFNLMRNDVKYCGAPAAGAPACAVCTFGAERPDHDRRIRAFFEATRPLVVAPSAVALELWLSRTNLPHRGTAVVPPARLTLDGGVEPIAAAAPLRIAHLGGVPLYKGWDVFAQLAAAHAGDPRYEFFHLGLGSAPSSAYARDPVRVGPDHRDAMIEAVVRNRIDVAICWSLWPENFCFTVHEALAGGAFVVAREAAGNIWPAVETNAPAQGCAIEDEASLARLFESGEIRTRVAQSTRRMGRLTPGGNTAELLLADRVAIPALRVAEEVGQ